MGMRERRRRVAAVRRMKRILTTTGMLCLSLYLKQSTKIHRVESLDWLEFRSKAPNRAHPEV